MQKVQQESIKIKASASLRSPQSNKSHQPIVNTSGQRELDQSNLISKLALKREFFNFSANILQNQTNKEGQEQPRANFANNVSSFNQYPQEPKKMEYIENNDYTAGAHPEQL